MSDGFDIDVDAIGAVAAGFADTSEAITMAAESLSRCSFGSAASGRNYGDVGERIAAAYGVGSSSLRRWSEATDDNVDRLRISIDGYRSTDDAMSHSLGGHSGGMGAEDLRHEGPR